MGKRDQEQEPARAGQEEEEIENWNSWSEFHSDGRHHRDMVGQVAKQGLDEGKK